MPELVCKGETFCCLQTTAGSPKICVISSELEICALFTKLYKCDAFQKDQI